MKNHLSDLLHSYRFIMGSDDDQPIVMEIYAGFNFRDQLTISVDFINYDDYSYNCSTAAVIDIDDAKAMARRHEVRYHRLPAFIAECMEDWRRIINPSLNQVRDCFKEITECLLDERCRFRITRTTGKNHYICC